MITFIARHAANGQSNLLGCDDGTIRIYRKPVSSNGIESPVHFYMCELVDDGIIHKGKTYLFAYESMPDIIAYTTSIKEINGKFIGQFLVLKTTDTGPEFSGVTKYAFDEDLKNDVEIFNKRHHIDNLPEKCPYDGFEVMYAIENYEESCNKILEIFCKKHGYDYEDSQDMWVGNEIGTICCVSDMFINLSDMYYDIKNNIDEDMFEIWYWQSLEDYKKSGLRKTVNYHTFCKYHKSKDDYVMTSTHPIFEA